MTNDEPQHPTDHKSAACIRMLVSTANELVAQVREGRKIAGAMVVFMGEGDNPDWSGMIAGCTKMQATALAGIAHTSLASGGDGFTLYPEA